jgi:hypothetical protein
MSLDDKQLDQLLNQSLPAVADQGFSVRTMRRMLADHRRMQLLMWGLILLGVLPVLIAMPFADWSIRLTGDAAQFLSSPSVSYIAGMLVLAWVWKPSFFTR